MSKKYKSYFKQHYKYSFSSTDIGNYRKWFYAQWKFINSIEAIDVSKNMLEIGSGIGGFYSFIDSAKPNNYLGVELDNEAVTFSRSKFPKAKFINTSIENLSSKKKFKYVFGYEVLEHLHSPVNSINKINNLLQRNGLFIGTSPYPYPKNIYGDKTHIYVLHPANWEKLMLDSGFKTVKTYPMSFLPFLWRLNKQLNIKLPFYIPFNNFISTTLIIAEK